MSAIAGYIRRTDNPAASPRAMGVMLEVMAARGPDDAGAVLIDSGRRQWVDLSYPGTARGAGGLIAAGDAGDFGHDVAMGHRAFSMMDFSAAAHQPFWLETRDVCVALDGQVCNRREIAAELEAGGHVFRSRCDAEIIAAGYRQWGTGCFAKLAGSWALALYDANRGAALLSCDRVGECPLYVTPGADGFYWASDIRALLEVIGKTKFKINDQAVSDFLAFGYRDRDYGTFYEGINSFPQASFAWIDGSGKFSPERYWSIPTKRLRESEVSVEQAAGKVRDLLGVATQCRLDSDAGVAVELSGGMDSSALVAAASLGGGKRLSAYSIAFGAGGDDEVGYAKIVAERYPELIDLQIIEQPIDDFFDSADEYVAAMAEPFHSPNMLTNQRIWKAMAARGERGSLNGTAGDELFASDLMPHLMWLMKRGSLLRLHRETMKSSEMETSAFDGMYRWRIKRATKLLGQRLFSSMALRQRQARTEARLAGWGLNLPRAPEPMPFLDANESLLEDMTGWQMNYWMRSGSQSCNTVPMEVRMPFLDHRLIDFAFTLPMGYLLRDGWNKWILRIAMQDLLPGEIVWRKQKMGLPFPYKTWFAASRGTVQSLLSGLECPYINAERIMASYEAIGAADQKLLWRVISVALWWKKCVLGQSLRPYAREPIAV